MPWQEVKPMDQKLLFIADCVRKTTTFSELCRRYGISRKTGYKWISRYEDLGLEGLCDRSQRPLNQPFRTPHTVRKAIIELRMKHKVAWGAKKIQATLARDYPDWNIPSKTTIYNILNEEGLVQSQRRRKRVPLSLQPFKAVNAPNVVWSADFKGQFKTKNGIWCYPLTIMDHHSRYLLACQDLKGTGLERTKQVFERLFRQYGLPQRIRTDNGVPFASTSVGGLSRLSKWWIRLGIIPERIKPGKPQQNGQHERMHRTLKAAAIIPPAKNAQLQQQAFDAFQDYYNHERPHESLGQQPPAASYKPSERKMPDILPELEYPAHFKVALVHHNGIIQHYGTRVYIAGLLQGEKVGIEEIADDVWEVYFGSVKLGRFEKRKNKTSRNDYITLKV